MVLVILFVVLLNYLSSLAVLNYSVDSLARRC